ncbi:MAG: CBS domain-containing protein, partial [Methanobrevibacter sp.]|nr:CBS domain-containing protein [Methanobrevibacter sp.]
MDNILLVDTTTIRSIPKQTVGEIASRDVISFSLTCSIKDAAKKLYQNEIDGAPVLENDKVIGVFTLSDLVQAIANDDEDKSVGDLMSRNVFIVKENLKIANAIDIMLKNSISRLIVADKNQGLVGIVTRTDLIESMTNLEDFPVRTN